MYRAFAQALSIPPPRFCMILRVCFLLKASRDFKCIFSTLRFIVPFACEISICFTSSRDSDASSFVLTNIMSREIARETPVVTGRMAGD